MKRYLLFAYDRYYPSGGFRDFIGSFDTPEQAGAYEHDYRDGSGGGAVGEIIDTETWCRVNAKGVPLVEFMTEPQGKDSQDVMRQRAAIRRHTSR